MIPCFFVSDLHGNPTRYDKLFACIADERPAALFIGGDIMPHGIASYLDSDVSQEGFIHGFLVPELSKLRDRLGEAYPRIFLIFGNDDLRSEEPNAEEVETLGLWEYIHNRSAMLEGFTVYGYAYVPPTPFQLKDWERYDVSRYVDPGCVSPEKGTRSVPVPEKEIKFRTIEKDLTQLAGSADLEKAVFLFHTPPYKTCLDRAGLDGKMIDHVPMDVHVGSIAVKKFIEARRPWLTLHGHIHESTIRTGSWQERIGRTLCFNGSHGGPELCLVRFDLENPAEASRELI
ncbi:MAG: metallophosphoesterase family protein [Planctomycetota bacterium]